MVAAAATRATAVAAAAAAAAAAVATRHQRRYGQPIASVVWNTGAWLEGSAAVTRPRAYRANLLPQLACKLQLRPSSDSTPLHHGSGGFVPQLLREYHTNTITAAGNFAATTSSNSAHKLLHHRAAASSATTRDLSGQLGCCHKLSLWPVLLSSTGQSYSACASSGCLLGNRGQKTVFATIAQ